MNQKLTAPLSCDSIPCMTLPNAVSPYEELLAYEMLWCSENASFRTIAQRFKDNPVLPSQLLKAEQPSLFTDDLTERVAKVLQPRLGRFSVSVHWSYLYPERLQEVRHPVELLYYRGDLSLLTMPSVSVVGTRKCTPQGVRRARKLAHWLVENGYAVVAGLAKGVDTVAHKAAMEAGGRTVAVLGTPIDVYYPQENKDLQEEIATNHLLLSQVPICRYATDSFAIRRTYFPQRNISMAALSLATVIVEASDTSGTLTQGRECLNLGRPLFVLDSCFLDPSLKWPRRFEKRGAIRLRDFDDLKAGLASPRFAGDPVSDK